MTKGKLETERAYRIRLTNEVYCNISEVAFSLQQEVELS